MVEIKSVREKFLSGFKPQGDDCWLWLKTTDGMGYGKIHHRDKQIAAHRYSYEHYKGKIPRGLWVLHKCDTPLCVNPDHLFLGTCKDNVQDMFNKGRANVKFSYPGESNGGSKLTQDQVDYIREAYIPRHPTFGQRALARQFGVNYNTVYAIINEKTWNKGVAL